MNDDYVDAEDKTTDEDYTEPAEREDLLTGDDLEDTDLEGPTITDEPEEPVDEQTDIRGGKFADEEPDIDDVDDDAHPYPHP